MRPGHDGLPALPHPWHPFNAHGCNAGIRAKRAEQQLQLSLARSRTVRAWI
jgi:hypothetical protein